MNVLNFLLNNPLGNAMFQIILGIVGGIIVIPHIRKKLPMILLFALIMEIVIDGAHLANKDITHNLFFMLQLPLIFFFFGYTFNNRKLSTLSVLFLANSFAHMISDTAFEGGTITPLYPFSSQTYGWNFSLSFLGLHGAALAIFIMLSVWFTLRIVEMWMEREEKLILFPSPPPARIGKKGGDTTFHLS